LKREEEKKERRKTNSVSRRKELFVESKSH
jgi:hypothetical protein